MLKCESLHAEMRIRAEFLSRICMESSLVKTADGLSVSHYIYMIHPLCKFDLEVC